MDEAEKYFNTLFFFNIFIKWPIIGNNNLIIIIIVI